MNRILEVGQLTHLIQFFSLGSFFHILNFDTIEWNMNAKAAWNKWKNK